MTAIVDNDFDDILQEHYAKMFQALLKERLIVMDIANTKLAERLPNGKNVHYPRAHFLADQDYVKYTDVEDSDIIPTDEYLTIDKTPMISFVIDGVDQIQDAYGIAMESLNNSYFKLRQRIE